MPTVSIFKTRHVSKHMGSHPPGAHPQPTARARFSIPKDCHCQPARQPASLTFFSYLASFVHKWMQTLGCDWTPLCWCLASQSAAQDFASGSAMVFVRDSHKRHLDKNAVQKLLDGFLCSRLAINPEQHPTYLQGTGIKPPTSVPCQLPLQPIHGQSNEPVPRLANTLAPCIPGHAASESCPIRGLGSGPASPVSTLLSSHC